MNKISRAKLLALKPVEQEKQTVTLPKVDGSVYVTKSGELHIVCKIADVGKFDPEKGFVYLAEVRESGQEGDKKGYTEFGIEARPQENCLPIKTVDPEGNVVILWSVRTNAACMATVRLVFAGLEAIAKPELVQASVTSQAEAIAS